MSDWDETAMGQVLAASVVDQQRRDAAQHQQNLARINEEWGQKEKHQRAEREREAAEKQSRFAAGVAHQAERETAVQKKKVLQLEKMLEAQRAAFAAALQSVLVDGESEPGRREAGAQQLERINRLMTHLFDEAMALPDRPSDEEVAWYQRFYDGGCNTELAERLYRLHRRLMFWQSRGDPALAKVRLIDSPPVLTQFDRFVHLDAWGYEGDIEEGKASGLGKTSYPSGKVHVGRYVSGLPSGEGETRWPDGKCHRGLYVDGSPEGPGSLSMPDGTLSEGYIRNGALNGDGVLKLNNGVVISGTFNAGTLSGKGQENGAAADSVDFNLREGTWRSGRLVTGQIAYKNGEVATGNFKWDEQRERYEHLAGQREVPLGDGRRFVGEWQDWGNGVYGKGKVIDLNGKERRAELWGDTLKEESGFLGSLFG